MSDKLHKQAHAYYMDNHMDDDDGSDEGATEWRSPYEESK